MTNPSNEYAKCARALQLKFPWNCLTGPCALGIATVIGWPQASFHAISFTALPFGSHCFTCWSHWPNCTIIISVNFFNQMSSMNVWPSRQCFFLPWYQRDIISSARWDDFVTSCKSLSLGHHLLIWLFYSSHHGQLIVARLVWFYDTIHLGLVRSQFWWWWVYIYLEIFSSDYRNSIGWASQHLHLTSPCRDPLTSPTCSSPCALSSQIICMRQIASFWVSSHFCSCSFCLTSCIQNNAHNGNHSRCQLCFLYNTVCQYPFLSCKFFWLAPQ